MPRITTTDVSNHDEANEASGFFTKVGTFEAHWPPKHRVSVSAPDAVATVALPDLPVPPKSAPKADHVVYAVSQLGVSQEDAEAMTVPELIAKARPEEEEEEEGGEEPSAGSSSLTSESKPVKSGSSAPETEQSTLSPAPDAGSPSGRDRPTKPARSSSASSTGTSTPGTGASQPSQSGSSDKTQGTQATDPDGDGPK